MATTTLPDQRALSPAMLQRQLRRRGQLEAAFTAAEAETTRAPTDRRAWSRLAHVAFLVKRAEAAQAALTRLCELTLHQGRTRDAVRLMLRRASLLASTGGDPAPVAREALRLSLEAADRVGTFLARQVLAVLAVRQTLHSQPDPTRDALLAFLETAAEVDREAAALQVVSRLAVGEGAGAGVAGQLLGRRARAHGERAVALRWFCEANARLPDEPSIALDLEQVALAEGAWRELAGVYRGRANRSEGALRAMALEQLGELCEDELADPTGALEAYQRAFATSHAEGPLKESFRLAALLGELGRALETWQRQRPDEGARGVEILDHLSQSDLPAAVRVQLLEALATLARSRLGDSARADAALARAEGLRHHAQGDPKR